MAKFGAKDDKIRIVVSDDHTIVRQGLSSILSSEEDFDVIGEASNGLEAIEIIRRLQPDVTLMDLQMPGCNGVDAILQLKAEFQDIKIIILTTFATDDYIFEGIRAGAKGYLLKDVPRQELCRAIRLVNQGQSMVQPDLTARLFDLLAQGGPKNEVVFTERELEVLKLLARGDRNKEIATKLNISENTVKGHVTSIMQKYNVTDRTQAAIQAVQKGLVKLD
jgi:two-component system NarL family response regulator